MKSPPKTGNLPDLNFLFSPLGYTSRLIRVNSGTIISIPVTSGCLRLYQLLDEAAASHEPIQITGKRSNAALFDEEDWRSIQETLYLLLIPGMRVSTVKGIAEPLSKSSAKPGWLVGQSSTCAALITALTGVSGRGNAE